MKTKRNRLSPEDRRMQLLDCAGHVLLEQGLSKFTIDALAKEAGVSTPLIYKYFDSRVEILRALLARESQGLAADLESGLERCDSYDDLVRLLVAKDLDNARTGNLLSLLYSQPDVRKGFDGKRLAWIPKTLVERTAQEFAVSMDQAKRMVLMGSAASRVAADQFKPAGGDREQAIDDTLRFILGAFRAMSSGSAQG